MTDIVSSGALNSTHSLTTEEVGRQGVLHGGGGATRDLNVKSSGVWVGGGERMEGENVPVA